MRATVRRRIGRAGLVAVACALVAGCALRAPAPRGGPPGEVGLASWYGPELDGSRTASGEVFRPSEMTAAHPSLPIGTRVRVTNLENGRSVVVRINDRGPFVDGRVLDVSRGAAKALGMTRSGTARVRITPLGARDGRQRAR
jgi:rare lipoprotein A